MTTLPKSSSRLRFESFELHLGTGELRKNGRRIRLQEQPSRLLSLLASRRGELVTRVEIQQTLWEEGRFVEFDHAVNTAIKKVREALEDDSDAPKIIETLPRKGYRFIAIVDVVEDPSPVALAPVEFAPVDQIERDDDKSSYSIPVSPGRSRRTSILAAVLLGLVLLVGAAFWNARTPAPTTGHEMRVEVLTPPTADPTSLAISPDGLKIVYVAITEGRPQLQLRELESGAERSLPGTDGALFPFWSPNNRSIGFFADSALKRIDIDGGMPRVLADAPAGRGGSWNSDDVILFTPNTGGPIFRIAATGETPPVALTQVAAGSHRHPRFLPDNRHFLYFVTGTGEARGVYVGDLQGTEAPVRLALQADAAVEYARPNHVLFVSQGALFAQDFDTANMRLSGDPFRVAEAVTVDAAMNLAAVSASGMKSIVYRKGSGGAQRQFIWYDRRGRETEHVGEPDGSGVLGPSLSSDGRHVAMYRTVDGNADIWLMELERGVRERFTMDAAGEVNPVWSPDRRRIAFSSNRDGAYDLYVKSISNSETELLLRTADPKSASSWSPNGRYLLYRNASPESGYDIWALPFDDAGKPGKPFPVVQTKSEEREAEFSPDGNWIAYQSTASGRSEIYVQPFPAVPDSILLPVSTNGGAQARWGSNSELFYISLDGQLMSVQIHPHGRELRPDPPTPLFSTNVGGAVHSNDRQQYVVSPDARRFLMNTLTESASPITVILNWNGKP